MPDIRTSALGGVPFGTSETRPTSPSIGQTYYNGTLGVQEIYTPSGWLPATGANDFNVTLNGTITTATFTKEYFEGAYTINSALGDSTYDVYVYNTSGQNVGYTKSPSLNATGNFNKIVIVGGTQGDLLSGLPQARLQSLPLLHPHSQWPKQQTRDPVLPASSEPTTASALRYWVSMAGAKPMLKRSWTLHQNQM